ncbi:hypothetical protein D5S17_30235 [Pseudonocardiaceae bacterium YIM PH 21723]|nr:hypothetical protein D5S17_30235 [Pseudonocardiaceae bacterium YIM PH 21723]
MRAMAFRRCVIVVSSVLLSLAAIAGPAAAAVQVQQIAEVDFGPSKITAEAAQSTYDDTAASLYLVSYRKAAQHWEEQDRLRLRSEGDWFWYPLTSPQGTCHFHRDGDAIIAGFLETPSAGCSPDARIQLHPDGHFVRY